MHRKTFFDDSNNQVIVISIYAVEEGFKLVIHEPERDKNHNFEIEFSQ